MKTGSGPLLAAFLVAFSAGGCGEPEAPSEVELPAAAEAGAGIAIVEERVEPALEWASGQIASARHTAVSARVLARIEEVRVRAGSTVSEGDVLVVLDARDLQARVREAESALRSGRARLELARAEYARTEALFREGAATRQGLDQRASELREADAAEKGLDEALSAVRTALSFAELRSPVSGRVVDRLAEPGSTAVPGQPLLRIYDPSLLRAEVPVRESLAIALRVGQKLGVEVPALGRSLEGAIDELVPFAEPGARTLLAKVRLPATDAQLFAGMFARVAIPAGERRRIVAPAASVTRIGQLEYADVVGASGSARRLVTTGEVLPDGSLEVLSGLRAGERVRLPADVPR